MQSGELVAGSRRGWGHVRVRGEGLSRRNPGDPEPHPGDSRPGVHGARRAVRLWQDDRAPDGCRPRGHLGRRDSHRRPGRQPRPVPRPRHRDGVPELRALSAPHGLREHRLRAEGQEGAEERDPAARQRGRAGARTRPVSPAEAEGPFRRPAPARRDGSRHRAAAAGVPDGRAAVEPRREAPRADARGDQPPPARASASRRSTSRTTRSRQ